ncbi:MAG TPA: hypothetical protein VGQ83_15080 [Polyangia bacterium]|jgi:hypothetical protein
MRARWGALGVAFVVGLSITACRFLRREPPPAADRSAPVIPAMPEPPVPAGAVTALRIGVAGLPAGKAPCRPYTLRHTVAAAHTAAAEPRLGDLAWSLGHGARSAVEVQSARPVRFRHVVVEWYVLATGGAAQCRAAVAVEADGAALGEVRVPEACAQQGPGANYTGRAVLSLPATVTATRLALRDRTTAFTAGPGGYAMITSATFAAELPPPPPMVVSTHGDIHLPYSRPDATGRRFTLREKGVFVVLPGKGPIRVPGPLDGHGEVAAARAGDTTRFALAAPASMGSDGPITRQPPPPRPACGASCATTRPSRTSPTTAAATPSA